MLVVTKKQCKLTRLHRLLAPVSSCTLPSDSPSTHGTSVVLTMHFIDQRLAFGAAEWRILWIMNQITNAPRQQVWKLMMKMISYPHLQARSKIRNINRLFWSYTEVDNPHYVYEVDTFIQFIWSYVYSLYEAIANYTYETATVFV